ncbi:MAG: hypothetical protein FWC80_04480 [Firmicutes bacterium]|nr:hypothetical protein [Bacillota bacterium]
MKKRLTIIIMLLALLSAFAVFGTGCSGSDELSLNNIAQQFRQEGFIVEIEDGSPVLFAMRFGGGEMEMFMLWEFSTRAGAEGGYDLMKTEMLEYGQTAHYYGTRSWFGSAIANQLANYLIRGVGSRPTFPNQVGAGQIDTPTANADRVIDVFYGFGFELDRDTVDLGEEMGIADTTMITLSVEADMDFFTLIIVEPAVPGLLEFMLGEMLGEFGDDASTLAFMKEHSFFSQTMLWLGTPNALDIFNYVLAEL